MAITHYIKTVSSVLMVTVRRVLTAVVVTRVCLGTGDQRVTGRVVHGVKVLCVT